MNDRFTKACLLAAIALLSVIAFRPYLQPTDAHAAGKWTYKTVGTQFSDVAVDQVLKQYSADGWELVATIYGGQQSMESGVGLLIFRK